MSATPVRTLTGRRARAAALTDPLAAMPLPTDWTPEGLDHVLVDALVGAARDVDPDVSLETLIGTLRRRSPALHAHVGGGIYRHLKGDERASIATRFDHRYATLLRIATRLDPDAALALHAHAEPLYRRHGRSLVRYARLRDTTANALRRLAELAGHGHDIVPVSAAPDESFDRHVMPLDSPWRAVLAHPSPRSARLELTLPAPRARVHRRLSARDDADRAAPRWLDLPDESPLESLRLHVLNDARITLRPSCVTHAGDDGGRRIVGATSDLYHHSSILGKVGLGQVRRRLPLAWLVPRFGPPGNHYHAIADKLAGLAAYRVLGLDCPIVAAVAPGEVERHLMRNVLDIDPDDVIVDANAAVAVERAIVPDQKTTRALFYDLCATTPGDRSPFGEDVYISRRGGGGRVLVNEGDVEDALAGRGFDIVRMEEHPLETQLAIAARARRIVGPHGAGLVNAVFAARGCALLELVPATYMNSCFVRLALDCGHRHGVLIGEAVDGDAPGGIGFRIDVERLHDVLDDVPS